MYKKYVLIHFDVTLKTSEYMIGNKTFDVANYINNCPWGTFYDTNSNTYKLFPAKQVKPQQLKGFSEKILRMEYKLQISNLKPLKNELLTDAYLHLLGNPFYPKVFAGVKITVLGATISIDSEAFESIETVNINQ